MHGRQKIIIFRKLHNSLFPLFDADAVYAARRTRGMRLALSGLSDLLLDLFELVFAYAADGGRPNRREYPSNDVPGAMPPSGSPTAGS